MALHCRENMMTLRNTLDIYRISFHMRKHYYAHTHRCIEMLKMPC